MDPRQLARYSRQVLFSAIGEDGQEKIRRATVAIVGCGALGSFQAEILTRGGVGCIKLIDRDCVDFSNLQRQTLYDEADAENETPKAIAALQRLQRLNRDVRIDSFVTDLTPTNGEELLIDCDLVLDGTDNFETRYLLNDISVKESIPWIYGAAIGSYGIVMPIAPGRGPCFACMFPEPPKGAQPTCDVDGVLGAVTATVAARQTALAFRLLVGWADFECRVETTDVWTGKTAAVTAQLDPHCHVCRGRNFQYLDGFRRKPVSLCGRNAVQLHENARPLDLADLALRLRLLGEVRVNDFALRMTLPKYELTFFADGRAIVKGTTDVAVARSLYARLIGA
jgi:molybdopterin/thiamine biosynthesis adenylyltransferase